MKKVYFQAVFWMDLYVGIRRVIYSDEEGVFCVSIGWYKEKSWWRNAFVPLTGKLLKVKELIPLPDCREVFRTFVSREEMESNQKKNFLDHKEITIESPYP